MRFKVLPVALVLSACAAQPLQVVGPYAARLSDSDIQQIKLLVAARPYLGRIRKLEVARPDKVHVESGHTDSLGGWKGSGFFVIKRDGKWLIDETSGIEATNERTIFTE